MDTCELHCFCKGWGCIPLLREKVRARTSTEIGQIECLHYFRDLFFASDLSLSLCYSKIHDNSNSFLNFALKWLCALCKAASSVGTSIQRWLTLKRFYYKRKLKIINRLLMFLISGSIHFIVIYITFMWALIYIHELVVNFSRFIT